MQPEGLTALIYGATGAVGSVVVRIYSKLLFNCWTHRNGLAYIVSSGNNYRSGKSIRTTTKCNSRSLKALMIIFHNLDPTKT